MGAMFSAPEAERIKYMKSPNFDDQEAVTRYVCELGSHDFAAIVSIGPIGVGKSSNLNTIASYLNSHLEQEAGCGVGTASMTREKRLHVISYQGKPVKWKWLDTPGDLFQELVEKRKGVASGCVTEQQYNQQVEETVLQPMRYHQAGCVMAMLSAVEVNNSLLRHDDRGNTLARVRIDPMCRLKTNLQVLKHLHEAVLQEGMRMLVILTKVDLIDTAVDADVVNVATSRAVNEMRSVVSLETGVPVNQVHPVVNLVKDFDPMDNLPLGQLALFNVRAALHAARHYSHMARHPSRAGSAAWDTLTIPGSLDSEDGLSGKSHKLALEGASQASQQYSEMSSFHNVYTNNNMPDVDEGLDSRSVGRFSEVCTDIDGVLISEASEQHRSVSQAGSQHGDAHRSPSH